jgi:hypothetical protein
MVVPVPAVHDAVDPAARAAVRLRPLDRATFDRMRLASALQLAGLDTMTIERTRIALELPHPRTMPDAASLAASWLADPDVRAFIQVHVWDGVEWLVRERWVTLVQLADALDVASGSKGSSPAIARLRRAAEAAEDRVDGIVAAAATPTKDSKPAKAAKAAKATPAKRGSAAPAKGAPRPRR